MALPTTRYLWNKNRTNTAPLSDALKTDGYPIAAIPTSAQFNELWNTVSALAYQAPSTGEIKITLDPDPIWAVIEGFTAWIKYIDGTIGNASSGGTVRANADTLDLFTLIWNNTSDANCPVSGGRGGSAAADFSANKNIQLPLINGRTFINAANLVDYELAQAVGSTTHALTDNENGAHAHQSPDGNPFITFRAPFGSVGGTGASSSGSNMTASSGNGDPHNIMQPSVAFFYYIKL